MRYYEAMNNTAAPTARLTRVRPGWYSFNSFRRGLSFDILDEGGFWRIIGTDETVHVPNLDAARAYVAEAIRTA